MPARMKANHDLTTSQGILMFGFSGPRSHNREAVPCGYGVCKGAKHRARQLIARENGAQAAVRLCAPYTEP